MGDDRNNKEMVYVQFSGRIDCCAHCPYYKEELEMGAVLNSCGALPGEGYDKLLNDINYRNSTEKISQRCPFR